MTTGSRILGFGLALALVIAGIMCAALISGGTGQILALVLISIGFVAATSLVFLEVGLSEDRQRSRDAERSRAARDQTPRRPWKLTRARSHRRRLG